MTQLKILLFMTGLTLVACASKKQIYPDRLVDKNNRHIYINDKLDFSIWYFDIISSYNRQTDKIDFKKTNVPLHFQKHLKQSVKRPSEILFQAHRTTMSDEDILGVLYSNKGDLQGFSNKIIKDLATFIPKDSLKFQPYQTTSGYLIGSKAYKEVKQLGFFTKTPV
jgi:hypothetical protein